jgi:5-deoxy-glucuronate isomerase
LVRPAAFENEYLRVTPANAGWDLLSFGARRLSRGQSWSHQTGENELALVVLGGVTRVHVDGTEWSTVGRRSDVFSGLPYAVYIGRLSQLTIEAVTDEAHIAFGWCPASKDYPSCLITPDNITIEIRGGGNASRQINSIIPPGFPCQRLVVVEVYTPSGNWSSYPPHKHDQHREDESGNLVEADLEEVYFYQMERPGGYAYQRVYTADGRLDELVLARHGDLVLVPEGYHPVVSAHGYTSYYLNMLAGSAQSLANSDDPDYAWIKQAWDAPDPRLPIVTAAMERESR